MREIKFRAWEPDGSQMVYDISPCYGVHGWLLSGDYILAHPNTIAVMQYTGLHDKNGREIYEGDILQGLYKVNYGMTTQRKLKCVTWKTTQQGVGFNVGVSKIWEIIGNVYEHPELLMKKPAA
jgi:hypothetical protein